MTNSYDLGVKFTLKAQNECIKCAQMICNFTSNNTPNLHFACHQAKKQSHFPKFFYLNKIVELHYCMHDIRPRDFAFIKHKENFEVAFLKNNRFTTS